MAKEKRLAPIFGALGLLSFAGISILMLLPSKGQRDYKLSIKTLAMTLFSCGIFIYWFGSTVDTSTDVQDFHDRLTSLSKSRQEFPSSALQANLQVYKEEQLELHQLMTEIVALANTDGMRPNQTSNLANAMMNELARYIAWRQYQTFLHHSEKKKLPEALAGEFQKEDERLFSSVLNSITPQSNKRLYESTTSWTVAPVDEAEYAKTFTIRQQLDNIHRLVGDMEIKLLRESDAAPTISFDNLNLPHVAGATTKQKKNHLEYVFAEGELSGKTLAIGFYMTKNKARRRGKVYYSINYKVLNNEVPATYMSNILSVLSKYQ